MPGEISRNNPGPNDNCPYVPNWCYENSNPPMCSCGHHHGYHNDKGVCLKKYQCKCTKYDGEEPFPDRGEGERNDMDTKLIRARIENISKQYDKTEHEKIEKHNTALQDFIVWLLGYLDAIDDKNSSSIKVMVDALNKTKDTINMETKNG